MWYIAGSLVLILAGTALAGITRLKAVEPDNADTTDGIHGLLEIQGLSVEQVNFLLARLEREEAPAPVFGAMCYGPMAMPQVADYICPLCGEKTIYETNQAPFILWELPAARRLAESINQSTEFSVVLDETQFCSFCSTEDAEYPALFLRVNTDQNTETVNRVTVDDLRKLDSFLQGNLYWLTSNDGQEP